MDILEFWNDYPIASAHVDEEGFSTLFVRKSWVFIPPDTIHPPPVLQLASMSAIEPGSGSLRRLLDKIEANIDAPIYVENVQTPELASFLEKRGFTKLAFEDDRKLTPCFIKNVKL